MSHHTYLRYVAHAERFRTTKREVEMRRHTLALMERRGTRLGAPAHSATEFRHHRPEPEPSE